MKCWRGWRHRRWGNGRKADLQQRSNFCPTCHRSFFNRSEAQLTPPPRPSSGARPTSRAFRPRMYSREIAQTYLPSKTSRRSPRTSSTKWTRRRQSHAHRKLSVGLALLLGIGAEHPDVWDAGAHEDLCGNVWPIQRQINHELVSLYFLVIAHDWRGHQFRDTLYLWSLFISFIAYLSIHYSFCMPCVEMYSW